MEGGLFRHIAEVLLSRGVYEDLFTYSKLYELPSTNFTIHEILKILNDLCLEDTVCLPEYESLMNGYMIVGE